MNVLCYFCSFFLSPFCGTFFTLAHQRYFQINYNVMPIEVTLEIIYSEISSNEECIQITQNLRLKCVNLLFTA